MPNFRKQLYPDYKANRNSTPKDMAEIVINPTKGGWVGMLWNERTQEVIHTITSYSPSHDKADSLILAEGLRAMAKAKDLKVKNVIVRDKNEQIKQFTEGKQTAVAEVYVHHYPGHFPIKSYTQVHDGTLYHFLQEDCPDCEGLGYVESWGDQHDCPNCAGKSTIYTVLPYLAYDEKVVSCDCGAGVVVSRDENPVKCPVCNVPITLLYGSHVQIGYHPRSQEA